MPVVDDDNDASVVADGAALAVVVAAIVADGAVDKVKVMDIAAVDDG